MAPCGSNFERLTPEGLALNLGEIRGRRAARLRYNLGKRRPRALPLESGHELT
jgi:hypothetical protein